MNKTYAVLENNKVVNIVFGIEDDIILLNTDKYIDVTNGWDFNNGIDGGLFFPSLTMPEATEATEE